MWTCEVKICDESLHFQLELKGMQNRLKGSDTITIPARVNHIQFRRTLVKCIPDLHPLVRNVFFSGNAYLSELH